MRAGARGRREGAWPDAAGEGLDDLVRHRHEEGARMSRESLEAFLEYAMIDGQTGQALRLFPRQRDLTSAIRRSSALLAVMPRGHAKTTTLMGLAAWRIGVNPEVRVKWVSAVEEGAAEKVKAVRDTIVRGREYRRVFPGVRVVPDDRAKGKFTVRRESLDPDPTLASYGIFATAIGGRADLLIVDDPVDENNAIKNPALREVVKETFFNTWMNILVPGGQVIVSGTPWHRDDLVQALRRNPGFEVFWCPVGDGFEPVWEDRYPSDRLRRIREVDSRAYDRGYRLLAISDEERTFRGVHKIRRDGVSQEEIYAMRGWPTFVGVDLAIEESKRASFTVAFVVRVAPDGTRWPVEVVRGRFGSIATAAVLLAVAAEYQPEQIRVERNGYQKAILEWIQLLGDRIDTEEAADRLRDDTPALRDTIPPRRWAEVRRWLPKAKGAILPLVPHLTGAEKWGQTVGLPGFAAEIERGFWAAPTKGHEAGCPCGLCAWFRELDDHPAGAHDDCVMASWLAREAVRRSMGPAAREGEDAPQAS